MTDSFDEMSSTMSLLQSWAKTISPDAAKVEVEGSVIRLAPANGMAASLEIMIETEHFFTITIEGQSIELESKAEKCVEVCRAIVSGRCRQKVATSSGKIRKVETEITLGSGEVVRYSRSLVVSDLSVCSTEIVNYEAY